MLITKCFLKFMGIYYLALLLISLAGILVDDNCKTIKIYHFIVATCTSIVCLWCSLHTLWCSKHLDIVDVSGEYPYFVCCSFNLILVGYICYDLIRSDARVLIMTCDDSNITMKLWIISLIAIIVNMMISIIAFNLKHCRRTIETRFDGFIMNA